MSQELKLEDIINRMKNKQNLCTKVTDDCKQILEIIATYQIVYADEIHTLIYGDRQNLDLDLSKPSSYGNAIVFNHLTSDVKTLIGCIEKRNKCIEEAKELLTKLTTRKQDKKKKNFRENNTWIDVLENICEKRIE